MICVDTNCEKKGLICVECIGEGHFGHKNLSIKKFFSLFQEFYSKSEN